MLIANANIGLNQMSFRYKGFSWGVILVVGTLPMVVSLCTSPMRRFIVSGEWRKLCCAAQDLGFSVARAARNTVLLFSRRNAQMQISEPDEATLLKSALEAIFEVCPDCLGKDHFNNSLCSTLTQYQDTTWSCAVIIIASSFLNNKLANCLPCRD